MKIFYTCFSVSIVEFEKGKCLLGYPLVNLNTKNDSSLCDLVAGISSGGFTKFIILDRSNFLLKKKSLVMALYHRYSCYQF